AFQRDDEVIVALGNFIAVLTPLAGERSALTGRASRLRRSGALHDRSSALYSAPCISRVPPNSFSPSMTAGTAISKNMATASASGPHLPFNLALTVVFSLKESLYKALYPQLLQFMDFSVAQVVACSDDLQQLRLRLTQTFSAEIVAGREFIGRAQVQSDEVLTWVVGQQ
ncbi:4'-phosphopantetheinyl transferase superfamily protein, partial [Candidatus Erwinia dacicola]|nr:4'-phosphopantetheinyl transferase superfamily protein [Candidatus Erwinia dacicola]